MAETDQSKPVFKSGFVALIGRPNVGKSTLLNAILGEKMVITSARPQTTRNSIRCIHTDADCQMVFVDTPGVHKPKNKLGEYMKKTIHDTLADVDAVLYLVEPTKTERPEDTYIQKLLAKTRTPVILVINKIDTVDKPALLDIMARYRGEDRLRAIVPVSAKRGEGIGEVMAALMAALPEGPQYFPGDMIIDQSERFVVAEMIREKALNRLRDEIPHGIAVEVTAMHPRLAKYKKTVVDIEATVFCEKKSHKGIIIGRGGAMLKAIGSDARRDIEAFLRQPVNLQLWIKIRPDWRESSRDLKDLGYRE
ncbi:GTPase Era [Pseudoramibacter faecis]|uniref:GTPase Era n=1 Tax=Pseudoramibacter faecis TaxID=3108534 RepID=UPI002E760AC0|nr:GTPase Era [Pseudoramibacter sp. HA2172]